MKVVRALGSRGRSSRSTSSTWGRGPDLYVARQTKELGGSLNATVGGNKRGHRRGSEYFGETHYKYDVTLLLLEKASVVVDFN